MLRKLLRILSVLALFIFSHYVAKFGIVESLALSIVYVLVMEVLRDFEIRVEKRGDYTPSSAGVGKYIILEVIVLIVSLAVTSLLGGRILDGLAFGFFFLVYLQWFYNEAEMERAFNDFSTFPKVFLIYHNTTGLGYLLLQLRLWRCAEEHDSRHSDFCTVCVTKSS